MVERLQWRRADSATSGRGFMEFIHVHDDAADPAD
jgi:hypothetical protein